MTSLIFSIILTVWPLAAPGETSDLPTNVAKYMTLKNGVYDNLAQYQEDNKTYDYIQFRTFPVKLTAAPDRNLVFIEYAFNGKIMNLLLCDVTQDSQGVIHLVLHNFTDQSQVKIGEYSQEELSKIKPEQIQSSSPGCEAVYELTVTGVLYGSFPDCRHFIKGKPVLYSSMVTCDAVRFVVPRSASEDSTSVPYNLLLKGDKFDVPDLPGSFVSPCK